MPPSEVNVSVFLEARVSTLRTSRWPGRIPECKHHFPSHSSPRNNLTNRLKEHTPLRHANEDSPHMPHIPYYTLFLFIYPVLTIIFPPKFLVPSLLPCQSFNFFLKCRWELIYKAIKYPYPQRLVPTRKEKNVGYELK